VSRDLPPALIGRWIHAREQDEGDVRVYRPAGTPLPPARGRTGFELRLDGTLLRFGIAGTDASRTTNGVWYSPDAGTLRIELPEIGYSEVLELVEVGEEVLKVRLLAES
jgi:hypothetical protein